MAELSAKEVAAAAAESTATIEVPVHTLDPDRPWHAVECSAGHTNYIGDDPAVGTIFECGQCGGAKNVIAAPEPVEEDAGA